MNETGGLFALDLKRSPLRARSRIRALHQEIRAAILDGRLAPGVQMPSTRAMAEHLGVSRNTAVAIYDLLLSEGYLVSRAGAGTFVSETLARPASRQAAKTAFRAEGRVVAAWRDRRPIPLYQPGPKLDFRVGAPDLALFPHDLWRSLTNRAQRQIAREHDAYGDPFGRRALRAAIARHVSATRAVAAGEDDVLVTTGAQQAFDLLARVLVEPGRTVVAVEEPGYPPVRAAFAAAGALVRPTPVDDEGLVVSALPAEAGVVCVTPSHQFPLGVPMSLRRRAELLDFAAARDAVIVEDDYDGEFRFGDRPLDALQTLDGEGRVFYIGTFAKCMLPSLRLGFVVAPAWARDALGAAKQLADGYSPPAFQDALAAFITEGHLARHLRRMTRIYGERRSLLLARLSKRCAGALLPVPAEAGLHLAARFVRPLDGDRVSLAAAGLGVGVKPFSRYASGPLARDGLVFGYGWAGLALIEEGTARLGDLFAQDCFG